MVDTGITTAYAAHVGSVLLHAQLPSITCFELFESTLLKGGIEVVNGYMEVPDGPGLGVEVDESALEQYRVEVGFLVVSWPGGGDGRREWRFTDEKVYQFAFYKGNLPGFQDGINLTVVEDDGSDAFAREHAAILAREDNLLMDELR